MFLFLFGTLLGCSDLFIPNFISMILNVISKESGLEGQLRQDIVELKRQLLNVNMVDQFPAYAKLQRKINTLTLQYKEKLNERKIGFQKAKFSITILLRVLIGICCLYLIWNYKSEPVIAVPVDLMWPFASILALPSCQPGEVSIIIWLPLVRTAGSRLMKIIHHKL